MPGRNRTTRRRSRVASGIRRLAFLGALTGTALEAAAAQERAALPFAVGERLTYVVRVARGGKVGRGTMTVDGQSTLRGREVYHIRFELRARKGPLSAVERTESWLDPKTMTALRFRKHERHLLSKSDEAVELFPDERRWEDADGRSGESASEMPLDELSFIYFLRTIPLDESDTLTFHRHFDASRNPIVVRVVGRGRFATPAGELPTVIVEMRVKDPKRYRGHDGVLRIELTDDHHRLPVRIESEMPIVGGMVLTLESHVCPDDVTAGGDSAAVSLSGVARRAPGVRP